MASKCSLSPNFHDCSKTLFIFVRGRWAYCARAGMMSNVTGTYRYPVLALNIKQHNNIMSSNGTTKALSSCIYFECLSIATKPVFTVMKSICSSGCSRTSRLCTVRTPTAHPLSRFTWLVDSNHISHSDCPRSTCTIDPEYFSEAFQSLPSMKNSGQFCVPPRHELG